MKKYSIVLMILVFLSVFSAVCGLTQETTLLANLDQSTDGRVSQMVWNETGDVITLVSKNSVNNVFVSSSPSSSTYTLNGKDYSFTTLSDTGVAASLSEDWRKIYIYKPDSTEKVLQTIDPGFQMLSVSVSRDGTQVLADSAEEIRTVIYDVSDGSVAADLTGFTTAAPVYDSIFSADGEYIIWHSRGTFAVQNVADRSLGNTISLWDFASSYELSPDNRVLAVGIINDDYENGAAILFDPESGSELGRIILGKTGPNELSFSADGSILWASDVKTVYRLDLTNFELISQITVADEDNEADRIIRIASSPDGKSAAVLKNDGTLLLVSDQE